MSRVLTIVGSEIFCLGVKRLLSDKTEFQDLEFVELSPDTVLSSYDGSSPLIARAKGNSCTGNGIGRKEVEALLSVRGAPSDEMETRTEHRKWMAFVLDDVNDVSDQIVLAGFGVQHLAFMKEEGSWESVRTVVEAIISENPSMTQWAKRAHERVYAIAQDSALDGLSAGHPLTVRERQVLVAMGEGLTNKCIGAYLQISYETVKEHVQHILRKLEVSDRTQAAVRYAKALRSKKAA